MAQRPGAVTPGSVPCCCCLLAKGHGALRVAVGQQGTGSSCLPRGGFGRVTQARSLRRSSRAEPVGMGPQHVASHRTALSSGAPLMGVRGAGQLLDQQTSPSCSLGARLWCGEGSASPRVHNTQGLSTASAHLAKPAVVTGHRGEPGLSSSGKPGPKWGSSSPPGWTEGHLWVSMPCTEHRAPVWPGFWAVGRLPSGPGVPATQAKLVSAEASWPRMLCPRSSCWWRRSRGTRWGRSTRRTSSGSSTRRTKASIHSNPLSQVE